MTRKFKALGLALFAMFAMSAFVASSASAVEFTAASYPVTYEGSQTATELHEFEADGRKTTCENAEFSGEATGESTTASLTPKYTECTAAGLPATVNMNKCHYTFTLPTGTATHTQAEVSLTCPNANEDVTITAGAGACVIHVPQFSKKKHVTIWNAHPNITGYATVSGIKAILTDVSPFFCPFTGNTTVETATYTGHLTIKGKGGTTIDIH